MFLTDIYKSKLGKVPRPEQTLEVGLKLDGVASSEKERANNIADI